MERVGMRPLHVARVLLLLDEASVQLGKNGRRGGGLGWGEFLIGEWSNPGAAMIYVGMNRNAAGKLVGNVKFPTAVERASAITPGPGGVRPITEAMLLSTTVDLAERQVTQSADTSL